MPWWALPFTLSCKVACAVACAVALADTTSHTTSRFLRHAPQVYQLIARLGLKMSESAFATLWEHLDDDQSGAIKKGEFMYRSVLPLTRSVLGMHAPVRVTDQ